jgi:transposase
MRPVDEKTRANIIAAKQRNEKRKTIALWFGIDMSTIDRIWRRFKKTGSFSAIPYTGRRSNIDAATDDKIRETIKKYPDITLEELIEELSLPLTISVLFRKLERMNLSYKKRRSILPSNSVLMCKKSVKTGN